LIKNVICGLTANAAMKQGVQQFLFTHHSRIIEASEVPVLKLSCRLKVMNHAEEAA